MSKELDITHDKRNNSEIYNEGYIAGYNQAKEDNPKQTHLEYIVSELYNIHSLLLTFFNEGGDLDGVINRYGILLDGLKKELKKCV